MIKIIRLPEFRKRMDELGAGPVDNTQEQMTQLIKDDTEMFARIVKDAKVAIE